MENQLDTIINKINQEIHSKPIAEGIWVHNLNVGEYYYPLFYHLVTRCEELQLRWTVSNCKSTANTLGRVGLILLFMLSLSHILGDFSVFWSVPTIISITTRLFPETASYRVVQRNYIDEAVCIDD